MFAYVARQPIVDQQGELFAYELLFRDGKSNCFPDVTPDEATSRILATSHLNVGLETITNNTLAFINFHTDTLLHRLPTSLAPDKVVVEITETVDVSDELIEACRYFKQKGYTLALDDYDLEEKWQSLLPFISVVKFDITTVTDKQIRDTIPGLKAKHIQLVAERVETKQQFEYYKDLGFDYFQGYFFSKPEIIKHRKMSASNVNMLELLKENSAEKLNIENINKIIQRDVSLSYQLLRFINNPSVNKQTKITSLKHAMHYMGEQEVRKFIALLSLANLTSEGNQELLSMSLVRARFCELTYIARKKTDSKHMGFLTGILSLIDTMMHQDMETLINQLPLPAEVKSALCGENNELTSCLALARALEAGHWRQVKLIAQELKLNQKTLHENYMQAIAWATSMQQQIK